MNESDKTRKILYSFLQDIIKKAGYKSIKITNPDDAIGDGIDFEVTIRQHAYPIFFVITGDVVDFAGMNRGLPFPDTVRLSDPTSRRQLIRILKWWKDAYYLSDGKEVEEFIEGIRRKRTKDAYKFYCSEDPQDEEAENDATIAKRVHKRG